MSELKFDQLTIPAADLGLENPLPQLVCGADLHADAIRKQVHRECPPPAHLDFRMGD